MATDILYNEQVRTAVGVGIDKLADAVRVTMGPKGRNVVFDQKYDVPLVTNDGVTIAKNIELEEIFENLGAGFLKQAAIKTNEAAGDGTTAAIVIARAILKEGIKNVVSGANPIILKRGIEKATQLALDELSKLTTPVDDAKFIKQIAMISGNNDEFVGDIVAEAFEKVGLHGIITVEDSQLPDTKMRYSNGIMIDHGYLSEYFINNPNNKTCELSNPYILVYDGDIKKFKDILHLMEETAKAGASLLIIASDVTDEALQALNINVTRGAIKAAAVKTVGYGDTRKRNLKALGIMLGATVVTSETGLVLSECGLEVCGRAERVVIEKEATIIQNPPRAESPEAIEMYKTVKNTIAHTKEDYELEKLNITLSLLSGGIAIITVGGISELEMFERKYRIEDAVAAVHAAVDEGVVPGGGKALLLTLPKLEKLLSTLEGDEKTGAAIVLEALKAPIKQIAENAGVDGNVVLENVIKNKNIHYGFNALTLSYGDMFEFGVIDPTKVIRTSLESASSIATLLLTTDAGVADPAGPKDVKTEL